MASLKKKSSGGGGANWMDTYGDMVTLLLCFFVLLYSMSTIDQEKWKMIVQSFNRDRDTVVSETDDPRGPEGDDGPDGGNGLPATTEEEDALEELFEFLETYAANQASSASDQSDSSSPIAVSLGDGYIYISFSNSVFFAGDRYDLLPAGREVLDTILPALDQAAPAINEIVVTGHTATALRDYNVDFDFRLSTNRAVTVVAYLLQNSMALDPARVYPEGRGQWLPVAGNDLESDRAQNRRVEMIISGVDLEDALSDSIDKYYTTIGQEAPESVRAEYSTQPAAD